MLKLVEVVIGLVLIYVSLDRFSRAGQVEGLLYGLVAIAGLVLAVHGILVFNVPEFFSSPM
jgi:Co/Zn/Cd efflux system component